MASGSKSFCISVTRRSWSSVWTSAPTASSPYVQHSSRGERLIRLREFAITLACFGEDCPRFKHALIGLEHAFSSKGADHISRQLVALMQKQLHQRIKQRKLASCFGKLHPDELKFVLFLDVIPV